MLLSMELLLAALAEAIFGVTTGDLARQPGLAARVLRRDAPASHAGELDHPLHHKINSNNNMRDTINM
jgi:hypothetical protein